MIRRILSSLALLCAAVALPAQSTTPLGNFAIDFNYAFQSQAANVYTFSPSGLCTRTAGSVNYFPFATNAPVYVQDATAANSERLTPAAIVKTASTCGVTIAPANAHYSFRLSSGTAGLQEALNTLAVTTLPYPRIIFLDDRWKNQITSMGLVPATVIGQVTGNAKAVLIDLTAYTNGRWTSYAWSGTAYAAQ